ncbi:MAG: HEAT repeat domain-containing protein [Armatimonadetes bacterium]|nr:HEAT repeat domain-containing protein [Anaerolineae bacterium]
MNSIPTTLIDKLHHPDHNERSAAVFELDRLDNAAKLSVLIQALRTDPDLYVREDLTYAIMNMGSLAVAPLMTLLNDEDAQIRHHAAHTLGKIGDASAVDALTNALQDSNAALVVQKVIFALGQIGDAAAVPALVALVGHTERTVQTALITVLEHFGDSAVPLLLQAMQHERWQVREQAADILGGIGDAAALPSLIDALQDDQWQVRFAAVTALGHLGSDAAHNALRNLPDDPEPKINDLITRLLKPRTGASKRLNFTL